MEQNSVVWFEIYVDDLNRATKFYESVLGVTLARLNVPSDGGIEMMAFPSNDEKYGAAGALVRMAGCPAGGNSTLVYFSSEDCAVEESRVESAGGRIQKPKMAIGENGFISLCSDTEGNMFGLHSMK